MSMHSFAQDDDGYWYCSRCGLVLSPEEYVQRADNMEAMQEEPRDD